MGTIGPIKPDPNKRYSLSEALDLMDLMDYNNPTGTQTAKWVRADSGEQIVLGRCGTTKNQIEMKDKIDEVKYGTIENQISANAGHPETKN